MRALQLETQSSLLRMHGLHEPNLLCSIASNSVVHIQQWTSAQDEQLRTRKPCTFFSDEFRSPLAVADIMRIVRWLLSDDERAARLHGHVCNMGGPDRMSRLDMAHAVARHCGLSTACVESALSASVTRDALSPLDISMDSSKLQRQFPFRMQHFGEGLRDAFQAG
jgi:dTDP-4-dehydrorhamnose reductase